MSTTAIIDSSFETGLAARRTPSIPRTKRYAVKAVWRTLQGEGAWAGRPAVFVRFVGCNMWTGYEGDRDRGFAPCSAFCDTDFRKEGSVKLAASDLADEIESVAAEVNSEDPVRFVVLTGGEPLLQADATLVCAMHDAGFEVAVETNGTVALADAFTDASGRLVPPDWVVCSPKLPEDQLALEWMDELKLVVPEYQPDAYARLVERVRAHQVGGSARRYLWLQPEDGPRLAEATTLAVETALANPTWRVSVQTHKILDID
jgi:organic radical activating enzyme